MPLPDLNGRTALITGAGRGIGRAIAVDLAVAGASVAVVARNAEQLVETILQIELGDGDGVAFVRDLGDLDATQALLSEVERELGAVDILINNAGTVAPLGPTQSLDGAEVTRSLTVNVVAPLVLSAAAIPSMRVRGWGRIVNVSSGVVANPGAMVGGNTYALTKSALEAHSLNLANELAGTGISVNIYRPGRVDTAMQEWIRGQDPDAVGGGPIERFTASHASGELISPETSARAMVVRLTSDESGGVWDVTDDLIASRSRE